MGICGVFKLSLLYFVHNMSEKGETNSSSSSSSSSPKIPKLAYLSEKTFREVFNSFSEALEAKFDSLESRCDELKRTLDSVAAAAQRQAPSTIIVGQPSGDFWIKVYFDFVIFNRVWPISPPILRRAQAGWHKLPRDASILVPFLWLFPRGWHCILKRFFFDLMVVAIFIRLMMLWEQSIFGQTTLGLNFNYISPLGHA